MNILIVAPRFSKKGEYYSFPFGLAYVSSFLKHKGLSVHCLNLSHFNETDRTKEILEQVINEKNIEIVFSGAMSGHWDLLSDIFSAAKTINPDIITIAGGAIVTADPEMAIENMALDFGIIGEGEITAYELTHALTSGQDPAGIKGIIYKREGRIVKNEDRPPIMDLDSLPFPDYEGLGYGDWMKTMKYSEQNPILENYDVVNYSPLIGSRSCPFSCTFCYHPLGKIYRQRSLDNIFKEIDFLVGKYQANFISFFDELFSANMDRLYEFADRIKPYNIKWEAEFRVNRVNREMLERLKASNLNYMGFGVESMSDPILKSMKKMTTRAEIENAFKLAREAGILCSGNIILGDPAETLDTIDESINWWKSHRYYNVSLGFIKAIPDSPDYQYALKNGLIKNKLEHVRKNFPIINLTKIPDKLFNRTMRRVKKYNKTLRYVIDGELIDTKKTEKKYCGRTIYDLKIKCPVCGQTAEYEKFMKEASRYATVFCKNCYVNLKVGQKKAFAGEYSYFITILSASFRKFYYFLLRHNMLKQSNSALLYFKGKIKTLLQ